MDDLFDKKAESVGKKAALVILFFALCLIVWAFYKIFSTEPNAGNIALDKYHKVKIERYCQAHKVRPEVVVIESSGRMTYDLNGQRAEIR
jgi:hypothetical protein